MRVVGLSEELWIVNIFFYNTIVNILYTQAQQQNKDEFQLF